MNEMLSFNVQMLEALASFLISPPIIYIVGMVLLCFVFKAIKIIIN